MKISIPQLRLERKNGITYGLLFVVAAIENFAYLVPATQVFIKPIKYSDIGFIAALMWSAYVFLKCGFISKKKKMRRDEWFLMPMLYIVLVFASGMIAKNLFGQSLVLTLIRNRRIICAIILFYAIVIAVKNRLITRKDFITIIFIQITIEMVVDLLQFVVADDVIVAYYDIGERYDSVRVRAAYLLPLIGGYIALSNFIKGRCRAFYCFFAGFAFFLLAVICKHRAPTIWLIFTAGVAYLLWKKNLNKKIMLGLLIITIAVPLIYRMPMIQDSIATAMSQDGRVNSLIIRNRARDYYFGRLHYSPWLGFGEPYSTVTEASVAATSYYMYIREDNGVFGFMYAHGIVGIIWLILLFAGIIKRSAVVYKKKTEYCFLLYYIFEICNLYMGMHWYYDYQYPFFLMLALLECDYIEVRREEVAKVKKE